MEFGKKPDKVDQPDVEPHLFGEKLGAVGFAIQQINEILDIAFWGFDK